MEKILHVFKGEERKEDESIMVRILDYFKGGDGDREQLWRSWTSCGRRRRNMDEEEDKRTFPEFSVFMKVCCILQCCFCWLHPLLCRGCCIPLKFRSLYRIEETQYSCKTYERSFDEAWCFFRFLSLLRLRLVATLYFIYLPEIIVAGVIKMFSTVTLAMIPFLVTYLLSNLMPLLDEDKLRTQEKMVPEKMRSEDDVLEKNFRFNNYMAWVFLFLLAFTQCVTYISQNYSYWLTNRVGQKIAVVLTNKLYKKIYTMSKSSRAKRTNGELFSFLAYDVNKIDEAHWELWDPLCNIIFVGISAYSLGTMVGMEVLYVFIIWGCIVIAMLLMICSIFIFRPCNLWLLDRRSFHMKETLMNILQVKFFNREKIQRKKIMKYRFWEIVTLRCMFFIRLLYRGFRLVMPPVLIFVACLIYYYNNDEKVTTSVVNACVTYFMMLRLPTGSFAMNISAYAHAIVALGRIQNYLEEEDDTKTLCLCNTNNMGGNNISATLKEGVAIQVRGSFKYPTAKEKIGADDFILRGVDVEIKRGDFVLIVGKMRSGKTSLLKAILDEMIPLRGVVMNANLGTLSYCEQEVWLENETILGNILMCDEEEAEHFVDKKRLSEVLRVCAMEEEILKFMGGLHLEVGDNSITLSGGQKSRIALCRAVYNDADTIMMDNSLSSVDEFVGNHIFQYCLLRYLKEKTRIMVTNRWEFLPYADQILVMDGGKIVERGTFLELFEKERVLYSLVGGQIYEKHDESFYNLEDLLSLPPIIDELKEEDLDVLGGDLEDDLKKKKPNGLGKYEFKKGGEEKEIIELMEEGEEMEMVKVDLENAKEVSTDDEEDLEEGGEDSSSSEEDYEESEDSVVEDVKEKKKIGNKKVRVVMEEDRVVGILSWRTVHTFCSHTGCCLGTPFACACGCLVFLFMYSFLFVVMFNFVATTVHISNIAKGNWYMENYGKMFNSTVCNKTEPTVFEFCKDVKKSYYVEDGTIIDNYWNETQVNTTWNGTHNVNTTYTVTHHEEVVSAYLVKQQFKMVKIFWKPGFRNGTIIKEGLTQYEGFVIYGVMCFTLIIVYVLEGTIFQNTLISTSDRIFKNALKRLLSTSMSFYYSNPMGRILNRITYDVTRTDFQCIFYLRSQSMADYLVLLSFLKLAVGTYGIFAPVAIITLIIFVSTFLYFRQVALELKRMESISRSSVYSIYTQTLEGLSTIKSFNGCSDRLKEKMVGKVDLYTRSGILRKAVRIKLRTDLTLCGVFVLFWVIFCSIFFSHYFPTEDRSVSNVLKLGIACLTALIESMATSFVRFVNWEMEMNSVERLSYYISDLKSEEHENRKFVHENRRISLTPYLKKSTDLVLESGKIEFKNFYAKYKSDFPYAVKGINLKIDKGEKVLLIGKTGCGKSSLFNALMGIFDAGNTKGEILIDGNKLRECSLSSLRREVSIIPQEPVLFSGSLRENIDPQTKFSQEELEEALRLCGLEDAVKRIPGGIMEGRMLEYGKNFSVGEKRLFCLARGLVKHSKLILLDECVGIDYNLDKMTQEIVVGLDDDVTVLSISHRLSNLIYFEKIIVMEDSEVIEFGRVRDLIDDEESALRQLLGMVPNGAMILRDLGEKFDRREEVDVKKGSSSGEMEEDEEEEEDNEDPDDGSGDEGSTDDNSSDGEE